MAGVETSKGYMLFSRQNPIQWLRQAITNRLKRVGPTKAQIEIQCTGATIARSPMRAAVPNSAFCVAVLIIGYARATNMILLNILRRIRDPMYPTSRRVDHGRDRRGV